MDPWHRIRWGHDVKASRRAGCNERLQSPLCIPMSHVFTGTGYVVGLFAVPTFSHRVGSQNLSPPPSLQGTLILKLI